MILRRRVKSTLTVMEMHHGDTLELALADSTVWKIAL